MLKAIMAKKSVPGSAQSHNYDGKNLGGAARGYPKDFVTFYAQSFMQAEFLTRRLGWKKMLEFTKSPTCDVRTVGFRSYADFDKQWVDWMKTGIDHPYRAAGYTVYQPNS